MRIKKRILHVAILFLFFSSCNLKQEKTMVQATGPKVIEAKEYIVPADSLQEPAIKVIDERSLRKIPPGTPSRVLTNNIVRFSGKPKVVLAGKPHETIPGQDTFALPISVPIAGYKVDAGIPEVVTAKDPYHKDQNPQNFSSFSKKQGLKNAFVSTIIEDARGNLWIGHGSGVSKFDGHTFTYFGKKEGLADNGVQSILEDTQGNLWFGTFAGGVTRYDGKNFTKFPEADGLKNQVVYALREDRAKNIWIGTGEGATKYDGKTFTRFTRKEGLIDNQINDILEDKNGNIWLASEEGVSKYDGKSFSHFTEKEGLSNKVVNSILEDRSGNLWFATYGGGMNKYDGKTFTHYTEEIGLLDNFIFSAIEDYEGNLWFCSNTGITKYDGESLHLARRRTRKDSPEEVWATFTIYTDREGLSNPSVNSMMEDRHGNLWIATYGGGVNKYNGKTFTHYTDKEGLGAGEVTNILQDEDGRYWFSSIGGLSIYDEKSCTTYTTKEGLSQNDVRSISKDRKGNLWLGTIGGGVTRYFPPQNGQPGAFTHLTKTEGLPDNIVFQALEDQQGNMWFCTNGGVCKYVEEALPGARSTLTCFTKKEGLPSNNVHCMLEDRDGNFWFGTYEGGVSKYTPGTSQAPGTFSHFTEREGLSSNFVRCMLEDDDGNIWFGTDAGGITKYTSARDGQPASFSILTEKEGLCNNAVLSILEDKEKNLWFGTRMGLSILTFQKQAELFSKIKSGTLKESEIFFKNYTYENGFLGVGCTVNAIYEDKDGIVWIGANDRLTACHPLVKETTFDSIVPNIQLTGISLFSEQIAWTALENHQDSALTLGNGVKIKNFAFDSTSKWYGLPQNLNLAYNNNYVTFTYVGITMNQPKKVKYQYILEGNDDHWSAVTLRTEAAYGNLPHGSYTFKVKAMNADGFWSDELVYPFTIRPPWWLTWWSYMLYGLFLLTLVFYAQRFQKGRIVRVEQEKARHKQAILNERLRISQDLHDEIGATLSGISMYSHIAKEQIKSQSRDVVLTSLSIMQESAGDMVNKLNDIVWLLNPDKAQLLQLLEKLEEYAGKMTNAKNIQVVTDIPAEISVLELPIEARRNLYLIFKEAINNAVKYSQATTLSILVKALDHTVEFELKDNGIGFDREHVGRGNGLNNMQSRANEIGATLHLDTSPGRGTRLFLTYRLPS
mgnify:CR=1 FL=1